MNIKEEIKRCEEEIKKRREFVFHIDEVVKTPFDKWCLNEKMDVVRTISGFCTMNRDNSEIENIDITKVIIHAEKPVRLNKISYCVYDKFVEQTKEIVKKLLHKITN